MSAGELTDVRSALVVEDNAALSASLSRALVAMFDCTVYLAKGVAETAKIVRAGVPDLVILDVSLADGTAFDVLDLLETFPRAPAVLGISGVAGAEEAFRLAQRGIRRYVQKPIDLIRFEQEVRAVLAEPPDIKPHVRAAVGRLPLHAVEDMVRATMLGEALARSAGNRRGAARILQVSRQLLQHMLRKSTHTS